MEEEDEEEEEEEKEKGKEKLIYRAHQNKMHNIDS